jgi:hypothetical protein
MKSTSRGLAALSFSFLFLAGLGCQPPAPESTDSAQAATQEPAISDLLAKYTTFRLTTDLSGLSEKQQKMIPILIEAATHMDDVFWLQAYGDRDALLDSIADADVRRFAELNYGPWDRIDGDKPFLDSAGKKSLGANFYPQDMTEEELDAAAKDNPALLDLYTVVRRDDAGGLIAVPYSEAYASAHQATAKKLRAAAELAEDEGLRRYLELRAEALLNDEYQASDLAWMEMKSNTLDVVIGPIEVYEDQLKGAKAGHEAYVLVKDTAWSERLSRYAAFLPELQKGLPVADEYKTETPGTDSDLNAYDVVYYAGHSNAGSKTIAINLPNDEEVQLAKGTRRLQLKNAMRAKFDKILEPLAGVLIAEDQRSHVTFDAFFANTMFHEVAHGLGIKNTLTGRGTVREALGAHSSALEEGKADVLGLYMISELHKAGEMGEVDMNDHYVTFLGSIFRSIRFGSTSAHGIANMVRFNFFQEAGAFSRDEASGTYRADPEKFAAAMAALSEKILRLQGDGDAEAVAAFVEQYGKEEPQLRADLNRLAEAGIPVDVVFEQGVEVLGLTP